MSRYSQLTKSVTEGVGVFLFALILVLQASNILFRYTGIYPPLTWVEEFSRFSFIWILFLLWHIADRQGEHFVVDVVREKLSPGGRKGLDVMAHGLALAFAAVVLWASAQFIPTTMLYSTNSFEWLPMGVIYLVIPLGFVMVAVERLRLLLQTLRS